MQGNDLQARLPAGLLGINSTDLDWIVMIIELPYANHFILYVLYTDITSLLDLDDLSFFFSCNSSKPIPPITTVFDRTLCSDLISFSIFFNSVQDS